MNHTGIICGLLLQLCCILLYRFYLGVIQNRYCGKQVLQKGRKRIIAYNCTSSCSFTEKQPKMVCSLEVTLLNGFE